MSEIDTAVREIHTRVAAVVSAIKKDALPPRTHYNLACYQARLAASLFDGRMSDSEYASAVEEAYLYLALALEGLPDLTQWAQKDPALKALHKNKARFKKFIGDYKSTASSKDTVRSEISNLESLGLELADALSKLDDPITSRKDLIDRCLTPSARKSLADELKVSPVTVLKAAKLAELIETHDNIGEVYGKLLDRARVGAIEELSSWGGRAAELRQLLVDTNKEQHTVKGIPRASVLAQWIKVAQGLTSRIS
jgi:hypothetical protein